MMLALIHLYQIGSCQAVQTSGLSAKEKKVYEEAKTFAQNKKTEKSITAFRKVLNMQPNFTEGYLRLGSQYYISKDFIQAEAAFLKAIQLDSLYDAEMFYSLAQTQVELDKYLEAANHLTTYCRLSSNEKKIERAQKQILDLRFMDDAIKHPVPFKPSNVGAVINSGNSVYSPLISVDGQFLIFTKNVKNPGDFIGQEDIYMAVKDSMGWSKTIPMSGVNTVQNEGAFTISGDGSYIVFTACDRRESFGSCDLYYSMFIDDRWTKPINMGKVVNSVTWDSHPTLSVDGRTMIFSSRRKGSIGGSDLWMTQKDEKGSWMQPWNLGSTINTEGDDESPFLHPDGQTLYFRSNGRPGMGNFDIYYARYDYEKETWSEPVNLGYPINTEGNEGSLTVSLDGKTAWYASDKDYEKDLLLDHLNIYSFELYEGVRPIPSTYVKGYISDIQTKKTLAGAVEIVDLSTGKTIFKVKTGQDGHFVAALPSKKQYACKVEANQYVFYSQQFDLKNENQGLLPYILDIGLSPIPNLQAAKEDHSMILRNVFFITGSSELLEQSAFEIQTIVRMMNDYPAMKIKIIGHTDNIGNEKDNQLLSEKRAKSVSDELIHKGIAAERISYEGKGASQPISDNQTPEGRSQNRRTEMIIFNQ
ncbi:MAG: OmpA family protein [Chitinophagales bacterium]|nr:OmpA family protein [Chitinophagales bacterium]